MDGLVTALVIVSYRDTRLVSIEGGIDLAEDADSPLPDVSSETGKGSFHVWEFETLKAIFE